MRDQTLPEGFEATNLTGVNTDDLPGKCDGEALGGDNANLITSQA